MIFSFQNSRQGIIFGAGGIGKALAQTLNENYPHLKLHIVSTRDESASHLNTLHKVSTYNESELTALSNDIHGNIDFIINTIGQLNIEGKRPEKSLRDVDIDSFLENIRVNSGLTLLIAKTFSKRFNKDNPVLFSSLSALVGSIEENELGGWYSYRASKAALNMIIKNVSIELKRNYPNFIALAVHPGTTRTSLTEKFLSNVQHEILEPLACARRLVDFFEQRTPGDSGLFFHANGDKIPW